MNHICIICDDDALDWESHIRLKCLEVNPAYRIQTLCGSLALDVDALTCPSRMYIVVATSGLTDILAKNSNFTLKKLVPKANVGTLLLCGLSTDDFKKPRRSGTKPLSEKFVNFDQWKTFTHDGVDMMVKHIVGVLKVNKIYSVLPLSVSCEGNTTVVVSFDEPVSAEDQIYILMSDEDDAGLPLKISVTHLNPYTVSFLAPEHVVGVVTLEIMLNDQTLKLTDPLSLTYTSQFHVVGDLTEIYIHQLTMLCEFLLKTGTQPADIDSKIIDFFETDVIPVSAFELLFGIYRNTATEQSRSELPTLLHFAARYGFQELCSRLIDLPDADLACCITNKNNETPEDLARAHRHTQLASFLENSREMTKELDEVYATLMGYVRHDPAERYKTNGYLRAVRPQVPRYLKMNGGKSNGANNRVSCQEDYIYTGTERFVGVNGGNKPTLVGTVPSKPIPRVGEGIKKPPAALPRAPSDVSPNPATRVRVLPVLEVSPANGTKTALLAPLSTVAHEPSPTPISNIRTCKEHSEKKLIEIMDLFKNNELTIAEAEILFQEWRLKYQNGTSRSFRENQESIARARAEVSEANAKSQGNVPGRYQPEEPPSILNPGKTPPNPPKRR